MKKLISLTILLFITSSFSSCGSLEQWSEGLQILGNSMQSVGTGYNNTYTTTVPTTYTSTTTKEWTSCSSCSGSGRCKHCNGTGKDEYMKNGRCAGCDGKGGWRI